MVNLGSIGGKKMEKPPSNKAPNRSPIFLSLPVGGETKKPTFFFFAP